jgi:hypothetical protein
MNPVFVDIMLIKYCGDLDGLDICKVDDRAECILLDCLSNPSDSFLRCIRKCQCCFNKEPIKCEPGAIRKTDSKNNVCGCGCLDSLYDPAKGCKELIKGGECKDAVSCNSQYPESMCNDQSFLGEEVRKQCPKMCKVC